MARCFATAMSQAPGLSGTPDPGHFFRAATRASWARSSATPTSCTSLARPAMSRADSILQTASIVRCVSAAVMAADHTTFKPSAQGRARLLPRVLGRLRREPLLPFPKLGGELRPEVVRLEHLAD